MSNPQTENGYMKIATGSPENDVLTALIHARLTGAEYQIALVVLRKTWGFNKKEDWISLSQFEKETGLSRSYVCRAIKSLVQRGVLVTRRSPEKTIYGFNKRFTQWVVTDTSLVTPTSPPTSDVEVTQVVTSTSQGSDVQVTHKRKVTKENLQNPSSTKKGPRPSVDAVMKAMEECFGPLDDTSTANRRFAWLLIQRASKARPAASEEESAEAVIALVRAAARHEWWGPRIKRVETLFRNAQRIAADLRRDQSSSAVHIS